MKINLFVPPKYEKSSLNLKYLNNITNKNWQYSVNGRTSIYHILKILDIDKILIPVYICATVLEPLKKLNIKPIFYDLDIEDLNPSLESIKKLSKKYNVKAVIVASMYGNPAALLEIEKYCKENDILVIDDGAQSFGAKLNGKFVGTFGNAGFFSFSPGKPTAGHMGSFFWSDKNININRTKHCIIHYLKWLDFYYNRHKSYEANIVIKKFFNNINRISQKIFDTTNDDICEFEKEILGGILNTLFENKFDFRQKYFGKFAKKFENNEFFRIVKNVRGHPHNHKIVVVFNDKQYCNKFLQFMKLNEIAVLNGYELLTNDLTNLPNAKEIDKKVVELPIENDEIKMNYLFEKVEEFLDAN